MSKKNNMFRKNVLKTSIMFCIAMMLMCIAAMTLSNHFSIKQLDKQIIQTENMRLKTAKHMLDTQLNSVNRFSLNISSNDEIKRSITQIKATGKTKETLGLLNVLETYNQTSGFEYDYYIFVNDTDIIVTKTGTASKEIFYENNVQKSKIFTEENWKSINDSNYKNTYMIIPNELSSAWGYQFSKLCYVLSIYDYNNRGTLATIVIPIVSEPIFESFNNLDDTCYMYILSSTNELLLYNRKLDDDVDINFNSLESKETVPYETVKYKNYFIISSISNSNYWKYVLITDRSTSERATHIIRWFFVMILLVLLALQILLSLKYMQFYYKPLSKIIEKLPKSDEKSKNEFEIINDSISMITVSYNNLRDFNQKQGENVKKMIFLDILMNGYNDDVTSRNRIEEYEINKLSDKYVIAAFHIKDEGSTIGNHDDGTIVINYCIENVFSELMGEKHAVSMIVMNDILIAVTNINPKYEESILTDNKEVLKKIIALFKKEFDVELLAAYSQKCDLYNLDVAYSQTMETLEYITIYDTSEINMLGFDMIPETRLGLADSIDINLKTKLLNSIKTGDFKFAKGVLEDTFAKFNNQRFFSKKSSKIFVVEILAVIFDILKDSNATEHKFLIDKMQRIDRISNKKDVIQFQNDMISVVDSVCARINHQKEGDGGLLYKRLLNAIDAEYLNPSFNSQYLADEFQISVNYLLRMIKANMGMSFVDYIHKLRIDKAKELLATTNMPIQDIIVKTGFTSNATFNRVFKLCEGITAKQYRNNYN